MTEEDRAEIEALSCTVRTGLAEIANAGRVSNTLLVSALRALAEHVGIIAAANAEQTECAKRTVELLEQQVRDLAALHASELN